MSEAIDRVVAQGEAEEARLKAEGRVEQRKEVAELKDAGNAAFTAKDFDKACDLYSEALELDHGANLTARSDAPEHALTGVLFANRAAALLKLERPAEAETDCRRALQRAASAKLLARCALACLAQGGEDKVADGRNLSAAEILKLAEGLRNTSGRKMKRFDKPVLSMTPSIQGPASASRNARDARRRDPGARFPSASVSTCNASARAHRSRALTKHALTTVAPPSHLRRHPGQGRAPVSYTHLTLPTKA